MGFPEAFEEWYQAHLKKRTGERKDRLKRGLGHGEKMFLEKVWWPLFGRLDALHPEYEVVDWRGKRFFVDFLWHGGEVQFAFEIKGYGPHVEQADRTRYRRELNRELFLQGLGIRVVSIPYDELEENPALIRSFIRTIVAPYLERTGRKTRHNLQERELIRLAIRSGRVVRPADAVRELGINYRTAIKSLQRLCEKGTFRAVPADRSGRITRYEFIGTFMETGLL